MRSLLASLCLFCCLFVVPVVNAGDPVAGPFYKGTLADLRVPSDTLGADYKGPTGIQFEDLSTTKTLNRQQWDSVRGEHKRWKRSGARAVGDYTYVNKKKVDNITVRILLFESPERAREFWNEVYQREGAERDFKHVPNVGEAAVDSLTRRRRHVLFGNAILTATQEKEGNRHIVMLQKYMLKLEGKDPAAANT